MSLSWLVYARYLSGYSVADISKELMIHESRVTSHLLIKRFIMEQGQWLIE